MLSFAQQLIRRAHENPEEEVCGFVLRPDRDTLTLQPCKNLHEDRANNFKISAQEYLKSKNTGKLVAYYHSHAFQGDEFSEVDMLVAREMRLPLYLYSMKTQQIRAYIPEAAHEKPLEGRFYLPIVYDCVTLMQDYYSQKLDIHTADMPRTYAESMNGKAGLNEFMESVNMERVEDLKLHDVIIMSVRNSLPDHAAIYLDHGHMLHQVHSKPSCREVYGGTWVQQTKAVYRHKSLL